MPGLQNAKPTARTVGNTAGVEAGRNERPGTEIVWRRYWVDLDKMIEDATTNQRVEVVAKRRYLTDEEVLAEPIRSDTIEGVLAQGKITVLIAESGAGKTLTLLSLACALGDKPAWAGQTIPEPGSTLYIAFEHDNFRKRYRALRLAGLSTKHLYLMRGNEPLSPLVDRDGRESPSVGEESIKEEIRELATYLDVVGKPPLRHIVIDAYRNSLAGKEDASDAWASYSRSLARILEAAPLAGVTIVHHVGWSAADRGRGSYAMRASADFELLLEAEKPDLLGVARLRLTSNKSRDGGPMAVDLARKPVPLGERDQFEKELWSAVVISAADAGIEEPVHRVETVTTKVLRAIAGGSFTNVEMLRKAQSLGMNEMRQATRRLMAKRLITQVRRGKPYRITDSGLKHLEATEATEATRPDLGHEPTSDPTLPSLRRESGVASESDLQIFASHEEPIEGTTVEADLFANISIGRTN